MIHGRLAAAIVLAAAILIVTTAPAGAQAPPVPGTGNVKVGHLLADSGYNFVKKTDTVWYVEKQGKALKDFKVIIATENDLMVTFVIVAKKSQLQDTDTLFRKLLRFNHDLDRVKIGFDGDGDLFVRADNSVRTMDVQELKEIVEQVAASANEVYAGTSDFIAKR
jgi:Putative bacterial sensory transduction regulator